MSRQRGTILRRVDAKGFGFIITPDQRQVFFHKKNISSPWEELRRGSLVEFDLEEVDGRSRAVSVSLAKSERTGVASPQRVRATTKVTPYTGPTLELTDEQRRSALREISRWKLEARLDDIKRYFFAIPELNDIRTGDAAYVIGRKGTGKTAIVQYITENPPPDVLATKLTFKNFPFNELYSQTNDSYTKPNQYITIWKLIIYSAACRLIASSPHTDILVRQTIDKAFPLPSGDNLGTIIGKWIAGDFGINVLGTGVTGGKWFRDKKSYTPQQKVEKP